MRRMTPWNNSACAILILCLLLASNAIAAEPTVLLPEGLNSYYTHQPIELAVSNTAKEEPVELKIVPTAGDAAPLPISLIGTGGTVTFALPPNSLAPGAYQVMLGQSPQQTIHVSRGVWPSRMLVGQTGSDKHGFDNFRLTNAFNFGKATRDRTGPTTEPRRARSSFSTYESTVQADVPSIVYMYWTGYVLHKPWGIHKEWASADMIENMRLFNFHVAQRLRRFDHTFLSVGSLDEPGLPWGKTASGGSASGFAGWNVKDWIEARDGVYTLDPGNLSEDEFRHYMQLRAMMLREAFRQANEDIKTVWPSALYATDSYAPQAVGDGTDPMNQTANDIPTTHVFADYGIGKQGVLAGMYIEKAHDPTSKIAHAMNGQLFGYESGMGHPNQLHAYHLMMNVMLAAGLDSNWWLNYTRLGYDENGKMNKELLAKNLHAVNEPAGRVGALFHEVAPSDHDVAVLWSNTEIWMRVKGVMKVEASNADGQQKALMVADLPEDVIGEDGKLKYNAYSVGGNYKGEVQTTLMAVNRAGYPAHVLHEDRLIDALKDYKVLVITHQTYPFPEAKRKAIEQWVASGGTLIVDQSTTLDLPAAHIVEAPSVVNQGYAWGNKFSAGNVKEEASREKTYFRTNHFMESFSRDAAPAYRAALAKTNAAAAMKTDSVHLSIERHVPADGEGQLLMVANGYEKLPDGPKDKSHHIWNYAPYEATYTLPTIGKNDVVYQIEGLDWKTVKQITNPTAPQVEAFEPGEMKLYLVAPKPVTGLAIKATLSDGVIQLHAKLQGPAMPWLIHVNVIDPAGNEILAMHRATNDEGVYEEAIPLGKNAAAGDYAVKVHSPIGDLSAQLVIANEPAAVAPDIIADRARVFDEQVIRQFIQTKPKLTIVVADESHQPIAQQLVKDLASIGITAATRSETTVMRKAMYPRVWDPYMVVHSPTSTEKPLPEVTKTDEKNQVVRDENNQPVKVPGKVAQQLLITSNYYDEPTVTTADGKPFDGKWREVGNLLTVTGNGYVNTMWGDEQFVEPGVKIFIADRKRPFFVNSSAERMKTDDAFRSKWERPWLKILGHVGGHNLTPQLPEVYEADDHLILLGDSTTGTLTAALQASELLSQVVDEQYPGPGKALIQFTWSPFALEKNVIYLGATDAEGLQAAARKLLELSGR